MKAFIIKNLVFMISILFIFLFVNWFGDAANIFSKSGVEYQIAKYLTEGYNVKNVPNIDERKLQKNILMLSQSVPEVIVIGSSRIKLIGSNYSDKRIFNNGVSGCSIEDMIAIYQMYKSKNDMPKKIVIGIDPWIFNKNNGQDRWKSLEREFDSFFNINAVHTTNWVKYGQLFSPSYFQSSLKMLQNRIFNDNHAKPIPVKNYGSKVNTVFRLNDGRRVSAKMKFVSLEEVQDRINSYIQGEIYSLENYNSFEKRNVQNFEMFINRMLSESIEVEFIMIPYPPAVYDFLASNSKYQIIIKLDEYIREVAQSHNIVVTGGLNPARFSLSNKHFYDGMHLNENGLSILLKGKFF